MKRSLGVALIIVWSLGILNGQSRAQAPLDQIRLAPRVDAADSEAPAGQNSDEPRWYPRPIVTVSGRLQTLDDRQVSVLLPDQTVPTRYASERVLEVIPAEVPDDQQTAIEQFLDGNHTAALTGLIRAVNQEDPSKRPPVWRQQWLSMMAAQSAWRSGRGEIALEIIQQLDRRPLPPLVLNLLPIEWTGGTVDADVITVAAVQGASSDSPAVRLVAASWLLRSAQYRTAATAELKRLAAQTEREEIARLAACLLWQTLTPTEVQSDWKRLEAEWRRLPMSLRAGPLIALERLTRSAGLADVAKRYQMMLQLAAPTWHPDLPEESVRTP
ncbi:hypothetical protein FYK55_01110 [Roseiconus nitratireducens]|uniref:Uncharacterized protein n=1 Tax=Roseiconus nitratireducens TaxID=2605748 RepID=A0A5M6DHM5_9BACT|nr:hypothetical protein [Roseiconus nitratireducens]KAA5547047.1 hypothetical protein FYK55_01110 [Roseiconus nitratireducens]